MRDFEKPWVFYFLFFYEKDEAWLNAPSLKIEAWILKTLIFFRKCDFFFIFYFFIYKKNGWGIAKCA